MNIIMIDRGPLAAAQPPPQRARSFHGTARCRQKLPKTQATVISRREDRCCLLLQDPCKSCARGGGVKRGDVCYVRAAACVDESDHHAQSPPPRRLRPLTPTRGPEAQDSSGRVDSTFYCTHYSVANSYKVLSLTPSLFLSVAFSLTDSFIVVLRSLRIGIRSGSRSPF